MDTTRRPSYDIEPTTDTFLRSRHRTWAGHGTGVACDVCREPISSEQIEYEIEIAEGTGKSAVRLHLSCYQRWVISQA